MKRLWIWIGLMALWASPLWAGPLMTSGIGAGATWVVDLDVERLRGSQFGTLFRQDLSSLGMEESLKGFATVFGFHPIDDVSEVLLYGTGQDPNKAVVMARGTFDADKVLVPIRANPQHQEIPYKGTIVHRWRHEEKRGDRTEEQMMYGCIHGRDLMVMSAGIDTLKRAMDVLKGSSPRAAKADFDPSVQAPAGVFFQVVASSVDQMAIPHGQAALFKQTDRLGLTIGEDGGQFRVDLDLVAKKGETASAMAHMAQGLVAYVALAGMDQPRLADLAKKVHVSCEQSVVRVHLECDPKEVVRFLAEQRQRDKPRPTRP